MPTGQWEGAKVEQRDVEGAGPKGGVLWPEAKACGQLPAAGRGRGRPSGQSAACRHLDFRSLELFGLPASRMVDLNQVWSHVSRQPREASPDPGVTLHDVGARRGPGFLSPSAEAPLPREQPGSEQTSGQTEDAPQSP